MFNVAFTTFEFKETFHLTKKALSSWQHWLDFVGLVASTYLCFKVDMGLGVLAGVLITKFNDIVRFIAKKSPFSQATSELKRA
eukprot:gene29015-38060_t